MNKYTVGKSLTADTDTAILTVPTGMEANVRMIHFANSNADGKQATVWWTDSAASVNVYMLNSTSLDAGDTINLTELELVLKAGDSLKAKGTADNMSVSVTFEMYPKIGMLNNVFGV